MSIPLKDALLTGVETARQPAEKALRAAPVIAGWRLHMEGYALYATGIVRGHPTLPDGSVRTSKIVKIDRGRRWLRTVNTLYLLGDPRNEINTRSPLFSAALSSNWEVAYEYLCNNTDWPDVVRERASELLRDGLAEVSWGHRRFVANWLRGLFSVAVRPDLAEAFALLAANPKDRPACLAVLSCLQNECAARELAGSNIDIVVKGWQRLAEGSSTDEQDPVKAARRLGEEWALKIQETVGAVAEAELDGASDKELDDTPGVVVVAAVGGLSETREAKEARAEFKTITGVKIPLVPAPDVAKVKADLLAEFPYASELIDVMLTDLVGQAHIKFRPTIVVGKPGCGKSRFVRRLGEICGLYVGRYDGAGASDSSFGGTARRWSSGEPCFPLLVVKAAGAANPLMLIDEADKAGTSRHNGNFVLALLPMLEIETSKRFADPYVQAPVDLSHISFVLTANEDRDLPAPLKDRLRVLRMPVLTEAHVPAVVAGIVKDIVAERRLDPRWTPMLNGDEIEIARRLLGDGSIRRLRTVVERLLAARETAAARN